MGCGIIILPVLQELEELLCPAFLEQAHERTLDRLHLSTWYFGDPAVTENETARDLLELEVASNIGMNEDPGKFSRGDNELGDEIDSVIPVASEFSGWGLVRAELAVELARTTSR